MHGAARIHVLVTARGYDVRMKTLSRVVCGMFMVAVTASLPAHAMEQAVVDADDEGYLIGLSAASSSSHIGHGKVSYDLKPMWAFQLGPLRVSRSRARALPIKAPSTRR